MPEATKVELIMIPHTLKSKQLVFQPSIIFASKAWGQFVNKSSCSAPASGGT
jgi:hypothetical protein